MRIYLACPMSVGDKATLIRNAILVSDALATKGHAVFNPALTHFWNMISPHDYEFWMEQDFEWVRTCDALFRVPGESPGADREVALAQSLGKPIFYSLDKVPEKPHGV